MDEIPIDLPLTKDDSYLDMFDIEYPEEDDDIEDLMNEFNL